MTVELPHAMDQLPQSVHLANASALAQLETEQRAAAESMRSAGHFISAGVLFAHSFCDEYQDPGGCFMQERHNHKEFECFHLVLFIHSIHIQFDWGNLVHFIHCLTLMGTITLLAFTKLDFVEGCFLDCEFCSRLVWRGVAESML